MKEIKLTPNFVLKEVHHFKDKQQYGLTTIFDKNIEIKIKKNLPDWKKALAVFHELTHIIQFIEQEMLERYKDEGKRQKIEEKVAQDIERKIIPLLIKKYPPLLKGLVSFVYLIK